MAVTSVDQEILKVLIDFLPPSSVLGDGRKIVTTAGTAEKLVSTATSCKWVIIVAEEDNTGTIVIGSSTVVAAKATRRGVPLNAGDSIMILIDDLSKIYIDSTVSGEGVTFIYGG